VDVQGESLLVASLSDIIASKRAAGRPRDRADLDALEATLRETQRRRPPKKGSGGAPARN
jgi:hypothetical protein